MLSHLLLGLVSSWSSFGLRGAPAQLVYGYINVFGLCLRDRRPRVEFNQVLLRFQLAKVMIMTVEWGCAADGMIPI